MPATEELKRCEDCGDLVPERDFYEGPCPYMSEARGVDIEIKVCKDCYRERLDEV